MIFEIASETRPRAPRSSASCSRRAHPHRDAGGGQGRQRRAHGASRPRRDAERSAARARWSSSRPARRWARPRCRSTSPSRSRSAGARPGARAPGGRARPGRVLQPRDEQGGARAAPAQRVLGHRRPQAPHGRAGRRRHERDEAWDASTTAAGELYEAPIYIDDTPGLTILQLRAKARRMVEQHGLKAIMIDYLQLLTAPGAPARAARSR
jgi:hypothetical protein